ncbi:MAG: DUF993 family protein [Acidimicrobiales bacterium]
MGDATVLLPTAAGELHPYTFSGTHLDGELAPPRTRNAYAAAHVVADPLRGGVDWDATIAYRRYLWSRGLGVAEAMDTAQRGMGLDPADVAPLIRRAVDAAAEVDGAVAVGMATDALPPGPAPLDAIVGAYRDQLDLLAGTAAMPVIMASRQLAHTATGVGDYRQVYDAVLTGLDRPVLLHWLGAMFDPELVGYWGSRDLSAAVDNLIDLVTDHAGVVAGVKVSLLDATAEVSFRRRLPAGVACYTGDDFNYPQLIAGDEHGFSHALLGIFDAIADVAGAALAALDADDRTRYDELLAPTVPLSRTLFGAPTFHYKTGIVFLAYLRGHQDHFRMLGGAESARSVVHLAELVRLADAAGLFADPDDVARRLRPILNAAGIW